ncbi:MAG: hypothetical protein WC969_02170 [Elusimicrobiota bacterium]|jgi:hypothetical protein
MNTQSSAPRPLRLLAAILLLCPSAAWAQVVAAPVAAPVAPPAAAFAAAQPLAASTVLLPLSTAEASLRFAEFFAAPWPDMKSLLPALPSLHDPAVARIYTEAVERLLKTPGNATLEPRRAFKLAVLRSPVLQAALPEKLREAVAAEQEKIDRQRWTKLSAEIEDTVSGWTAGEDAAVPFDPAPSPLGSANALVLAQPLGASVAADEGLGSRLFVALPSRVRSSLARRSPGLRAAQISSLSREIAALLPEESFAAMASLPQTSQDYIVGDMLPKAPEAAESAVREIARHPEWPDYMVNGARSDADKQAWFVRLADVKAKLEELASLQNEDDPARERAMVQLGLGVLHAFSYGFAGGLKHRHPDAGHDSLSGGDRAFADLATAHLRSALALFEGAGQEDAALLTRFLLGKHAINGRVAYSNPGLYERSGRKVPEEPEAFSYEALAGEMLSSVLSTLGPGAAGAGHKLRELYFETLYFMEMLGSSGREPDLNPFRLRGPRADPERRAQALRDLLTDYLLGAPAERIEAQLSAGHRYALIERLLGKLRWALQDLGDTRLRDALFEHPGRRLTYARLIEILIADADCERLRSISAALPGPGAVRALSGEAAGH